jgi:hypothetical protein
LASDDYTPLLREWATETRRCWGMNKKVKLTTDEH